MATRRNQWAVIAAIGVVGSVILAGCASEEAAEDADRDTSGEQSASTVTAETPQRGGQVVYGLLAETDNWDPAAGNWGPWSLIAANALFDTLARYNAEGAVEPYLAEGFYPTPEYDQWRIKLREGVVFHNGEPFDAQALADNVEFHRASPLTGSVFERVTEVEVVDDRNLRIALDARVVQFPAVLTTQVGVVMAPEMIENPQRGLEPIGTGPFQLDEWIPDAQMVLVRNDAYWQTDSNGDRLPYLDAVEFRPIFDNVSRVNAVRAGELDLAQINTAPDLASFRADGTFQVLGDPESEEDEQMVMLNTAAPPFDDLVARQALAHATNRDEYNEVLNDGEAQIASGPFRPESRWYHDVDYPDYDPERARELVEEYEAENGPLEFVVSTSPNARNLQGAQILQEQWEQVGITAEIDTAEVVTQIANVAVGDYQATTWSQFGSAHPFLEEVWWACDYVEPIPAIGLNFARNCNEELTAQMNAAREDDSGVELNDDGAAIVTSDELKPYYDRVQEELAADLPYIWLHHIETGVVGRQAIRNVLDFTLPSGSPGLAFNNGAHPLHEVWIDD